MDRTTDNTGTRSPTGGDGFHAARRFWARKGRTCDTWWYSACVLRGDGQDKLSVPCAMFKICLYAAQRDELDADTLEVLDAWAHKHVCLIGFSSHWNFDDTNPWVSASEL